MDPADLPLRDIHLPGEIALWPPAIGWWLVFVLVLAGLIGLVWYLRKYRPDRALRLLKKRLRVIERNYEQSKDDYELAKALSRLLRQTALRLANRSDVASLTGEAWLRALDNLRVQQKALLQGDLGKQLLHAPYDPSWQSNGQELLALVKNWFGQIQNSKVRP